MPERAGLSPESLRSPVQMVSRQVVAYVVPAGDGGRAGAGPEFRVNPVDVILDGLLGEDQLAGDLAVGGAFRDEGRDLRLARGKAERADHSGDAAGPHLSSGPLLPARCDSTHGTNMTLMSARGANSLNKL